MYEKLLKEHYERFIAGASKGLTGPKEFVDHLLEAVGTAYKLGFSEGYDNGYLNAKKDDADN